MAIKKLASELTQKRAFSHSTAKVAQALESTNSSVRKVALMAIQIEGDFMRRTSEAFPPLIQVPLNQLIKVEREDAVIVRLLFALQAGSESIQIAAENVPQLERWVLGKYPLCERAANVIQAHELKAFVSDQVRERMQQIEDVNKLAPYYLS